MPADGLPSYSESVAAIPEHNRPYPNKIASARTALISSLVTTHIAPHLHLNALSGLSSSTLIIIPSNVSSLHPSRPSSAKGQSNEDATFPGEEILGFRSIDNLSAIRLQGDENSLGFWSQPAVTTELVQQIRSYLHHQGYRMPGSEVEAHANASSPQKSQRLQSTATTAQWRSAEKAALEVGEANAKVKIQEVCLRIENEMGLYETRNGKALVLRVEIGG